MDGTLQSRRLLGSLLLSRNLLSQRAFWFSLFSTSALRPARPSGVSICCPFSPNGRSRHATDVVVFADVYTSLKIFPTVIWSSLFMSSRCTWARLHPIEHLPVHWLRVWVPSGVKPLVLEAWPWHCPWSPIRKVGDVVGAFGG